MQLLELMVAMLRSCIYLNERANTMERAMLFLVTLSCFHLMRPGEAGKCHAAHQLHISAKRKRTCVKTRFAACYRSQCLCEVRDAQAFEFDSTMIGVTFL